MSQIWNDKFAENFIGLLAISVISDIDIPLEEQSVQPAMASPSPNHHDALNGACNVLPGSILWLLSKSKCDAITLPLNPDLDDGCYDHPVLILRADFKQAQASILLVRTLI